jgi:hypothetical protein
MTTKPKWKRTFDGLACPRGVAPEHHESQHLIDVIWRAGWASPRQQLACVAEEVLELVPSSAYQRPRERHDHCDGDDIECAVEALQGEYAEACRQRDLARFALGQLEMEFNRLKIRIQQALER